MQEFLFYGLATLILVCAASVIMMPNPLVCSLFLAGSMVSLGFLFFVLEAHFIAAVQLAVYAGAVMVLFVMVLMLFDLDEEKESFSGGRVSSFLKIASGFIFLGLLSGAIFSEIKTDVGSSQTLLTASQQMMSVQNMAQKIFTQYLLAFEILGLLLLLIAVGVVAVSRIKGGTHAR